MVTSSSILRVRACPEVVVVVVVVVGGGGGGGVGVGGDVDLEALENGVPQRLSTVDTAKTTSRTETPSSDCGTPGSGVGVMEGHSDDGSSSSSYVGSPEAMGRSGVMKRPAARFQNEAKHVSDQKRGVTTSYKNEEQYTPFHRMALFLVVMGVIVGLGSHGIDAGIEQIGYLRTKIVNDGGAALGGSQGARFVLFWLYDVTLTGMAALVTAYFSPGVEGSGIPAMKYMMDTDDLVNKLKAFSFLAVVVKSAGLILAAGGGLNIGREGPYTHLGGMVSYQLIKKVPFFNAILKKETVLRQVLAASAAVGLSSTFAATIGGVLFSIEITTLYYDIGNYFKAFVAAISGTVAVSLVRTLEEGSPEYIERSFSDKEFKAWQYPVFALMAVLCGFLGPLYVNFRLHLLKLARKYGKHSIRANPRRRWEYVRAATTVACVAASLTALLSFFPGRFTRQNPLATFRELLDEDDLPRHWISGNISNIFVALPVAFVVWVVTAALGTSVTVPSGDFIQTSVIGATLGRLIGEVLKKNSMGLDGVFPSTFALVGAAGLSCGATQTISAAVVIMEMTGSFDLNKPILLAAVIASGFSRRFGLNIYDSVMALNGLESLYGLDMRRSEEKTAQDIMETDLKVVPCKTTIGSILELLRGDKEGGRMFESYPVVAGLESMAFVGTISRKDLVYIVLTGGTDVCTDLHYLDHVIQHLPKKDLSSSWEKVGDVLHLKERRELFDRLPSHVKQAFGPSGPSAANTVRALKVFTEKISLIRGGTTRTAGKPGGGSLPRDPRDRQKRSTRMTLNSLWKASWDPDAMEGMMEDPFEGRPVDLTKARRPSLIAQRTTCDVQIDRSVWKAYESMPLNNVYLLFANLRCIRLFIISGDRLTGIISRSILFRAMSHREGGALGDSGRPHLDRSRSTPRSSWTTAAKSKKRLWFDILLGRGPRQGLGGRRAADTPSPQEYAKALSRPWSCLDRGSKGFWLLSLPTGFGLYELADGFGDRFRNGFSGGSQRLNWWKFRDGLSCSLSGGFSDRFGDGFSDGFSDRFSGGFVDRLAAVHRPLLAAVYFGDCFSGGFMAARKLFVAAERGGERENTRRLFTGGHSARIALSRIAALLSYFAQLTELCVEWIVVEGAPDGGGNGAFCPRGYQKACRRAGGAASFALRECWRVLWVWQWEGWKRLGALISDAVGCTHVALANGWVVYWSTAVSGEAVHHCRLGVLVGELDEHAAFLFVPIGDEIVELVEDRGAVLVVKEGRVGSRDGFLGRCPALSMLMWAFGERAGGWRGFAMTRRVMVFFMCMFGKRREACGYSSILVARAGHGSVTG
eukprot:jgi/Undpi1/10967/HiC_scaffold_30.g13268.m1